MKNYYDILQVNQKASKEIIDKAYNVLIKQYDPNSQTNEIEKMRSEQITKDLNEAYYVLSDVFLREQYDRELQQENSRNMKENYSKYEKNNYYNRNYNNTNSTPNDINYQNIKQNIFQDNGYEYSNINNNNQQAITENKRKQERNRRKIKNNQEEYNEGYEVGTLSALIALIRKIFSDRPDVGKIKNAKKKDIIIFIISILIVVIICVILWFIPFTNGFIRSLLFMN